MASKTLFPKIPLRDVEELIGKSPYLDLLFYFQADLKKMSNELAGIKPIVNAEMDFDAYKTKTDEGLSEMAQFNQKHLSSEEDEEDIASELMRFTDYIVAMHPKVVNVDILKVHYEKIKDFVIENVAKDGRLRFDYTIRDTILYPALKWRQHRSIRKKGFQPLIALMEELIDVVASKLRKTNYYSEMLEFQNNLIFCYLVMAEGFGIGISAHVVSSHLLTFRFVNASSWASVLPKIRMQYAALVLHLSMLFYPINTPFKSMLGFSTKTLADLREVMADASGLAIDAPFTAHQWVFRWFKDKIDAEVFASRLYFGDAANLGSLSDGEQSVAVELVRRFSSYRVPITISHLERFLLQFGTTGRIRGALRMLTHAKFYPLWELGEVMENLLRVILIDHPKTKIVIAPLGDQSGSTAIVRYLASHSSLADRLKFVDDIVSALFETKDGDSLYFVDDCLLSGTQTLSILGDLMGTRQHKPHHKVYCKPLSQVERKQLLNRNLVFNYCVATDVGRDRFRNDLAQTGIDSAHAVIRYGVLEHSLSKAFQPMGPIAWASSDERNELNQFASEIGYDILEHRARKKDWTDERRRESALGFSDFQRLLVFPYNVPKTTVTFLWENGSESRPWQPLFTGFD